MDKTEQTRRLERNQFYGIADGTEATVIDDRAQYNGSGEWLAKVQWNDKTFLINNYGRIING